MSLREKFFTAWAPVSAVTGVIGATAFLGFTQGATLVQALGRSFTDPSQFGIKLSVLNTGLLTTTALFTLGRWWGIHDAMSKNATQVQALQAGVGDLQEQLRFLKADVHLQSGKTDENERVINDLKHQNALLKAILADGGHQEDDGPAWWDAAPNSYMVSFCCKNHRECREIIRPGGVVDFELTDWAIKNWRPRIAVGTSLADWRVIIHVPRVPGPFEQNALLPAKKYLYIFDRLAEICERQGVPYSFANIRIAIVREIEVKYRYLSISILKRQTLEGVEPLVITYQRPATDKVEPPYGDKILVHRGEGDWKAYNEIASRFFHGAGTVHLTVNELRAAVQSGIFPDVPEPDIQIQI
jgi:hypothetical protein